MALEHPPERRYNSFEKAKAAALDWASSHGYDLSLKTPKNLKPGLPYHAWVARCSRFGTLDNTRNLTENQRIRTKRGTKKIGCQMALWIKAVDSKAPQGRWKIQHYKGNKSCTHNHPGTTKDQLPASRRRQRNTKVLQDIREHKTAGVSIQSSYTLLTRKYKDLVITVKDIQNERARAKRADLKTHTPAEACLKLLDEKKFFKHYEVGDDSRIQRLFFTDPESIEHLKIRNEVIMLDCTYQTNKYNIPLLNIIGASSIGKTTQVGLCFISGEAEYDFDWAMNVLKKLFLDHNIPLPRIIVTDRQQALMNSLNTHFPKSHYLLCRWHFNKCVLSKARSNIHKMVRKCVVDGKDEYEDHPNTCNFIDQFHDCIDEDDPKEFERKRQAMELE